MNSIDKVNQRRILNYIKNSIKQHLNSYMGHIVDNKTIKDAQYNINNILQQFHESRFIDNYYVKVNNDPNNYNMIANISITKAIDYVNLKFSVTPFIDITKQLINEQPELIRLEISNHPNINYEHKVIGILGIKETEVGPMFCELHEGSPYFIIKDESNFHFASNLDGYYQIVINNKFSNINHRKAESINKVIMEFINDNPAV